MLKKDGQRRSNRWRGEGRGDGVTSIRGKFLKEGESMITKGTISFYSEGDERRVK